MDKSTAERLVRKLRALAADRAAQPGEKSTATAKADRLVERFGIDETALRPDPASRPTYVSTAATATGTSTIFADWSFDPSTGRGRGVKVHRYNNPRDWKFEIPIEPVDLPPLPGERRKIDR